MLKQLYKRLLLFSIKFYESLALFSSSHFIAKKVLKGNFEQTKISQAFCSVNCSYLSKEKIAFCSVLFSGLTRPLLSCFHNRPSFKQPLFSRNFNHGGVFNCQFTSSLSKSRKNGMIISKPTILNGL